MLHKRLDVVHDGGLAVQPLDRGERRLEPGLPPQALERLDQRRLLSADVGAGTAMHDDVAVEAAAQDVPADVPGGSRLLHRLLETKPLVVVLAPDIDERDVHLERIRSDQESLDELVRAFIDEVPVLETSRLGLIGVAAQVAREHVLGQEGPFHPGRESSPSPASDVAGLDLGDQRLRRELLERITEALVPADALVSLQRLEISRAEILRQQLVLSHQR